jgi:hypothetical protein
MTLPNLIIVGPGRAGTTAAMSVLDTHPDVWMHRKWKCKRWKDAKHNRISEIHFFSAENYKRGLEWYARHFEDVDYDNYKYIGEKSPSYVNYRPNCASRIKKDLGDDVKIIFTVRDPVDRAYSQWAHLQDCNYGEYWEKYKGVPFHEAMLNTEMGYLPKKNLLLQYSDYEQQFSELLKVFDRDHIHVMVNEETKLHPFLNYGKLFDWLELDPSDISDGKRSLAMINLAHYGKHGHISDEDREYLNNYFQEPKDKFYNLLGREIKLWGI